MRSLPLLLAFILPCVVSLKIFIFSPPMGFSHIQLQAKMADELVGAGHDVVVLHPVLDEKFKKHWEKSAGRKIYFPLSKNITDRFNSRNTDLWNTAPLGDNLKLVLNHIDIQAQICNEILESKVYVPLKDEHFDVGMTELFGACGIGLSEMIGAKGQVLVSAIGLIDMVADNFHSPLTPSYIPGTVSSFSDRMSFWQRMINVMLYFVSRPIYQHTIIGKYEKIFDSHGFTFDFENIAKSRVNYLLINIDELIDIARPLSLKVKHIGGITIGDKKTLNKEFKDMLAIRPKGTVLVSFGSIFPTSIMPKEVKQAMLNTFKEFPEYTFIWKVDEPDLNMSEGIDNLITTKWMQQRELLYEPSVKVFVSHGGLNGLMETAKAGKPALLVPIFGDQFKNAALLDRKNTSIVLPKDQFNEQSFKDSLRKLLGDPGYAERATRLADLMAFRKEKPRDRLIEAVEITGRFGKVSDLDVSGYELSFIAYFSLDTLAAWALILIGVPYLIFRVISRMCCKQKLKLE